MKWFTYDVNFRRDSDGASWLFDYGIDYEFEWLCRRGLERRAEPMKFNWLGEVEPYDFLYAGIHGIELVSQKAKSAFEEEGIKGIEYVPVELLMPESPSLQYFMIVTPNEYERMCFKFAKQFSGRTYHMWDCKFHGLNDESDFWIGPLSMNDQTTVCSEKVMRLKRKHKLSNIMFEPLEEYESYIIDYEKFLCEDGELIE